MGFSMCPAGFWRRFFAYFFDGIIINIVSFVFVLLINFLNLNTIISEVFTVVASLVIQLFYFPCLESSSSQATLGQRVLKIQVCSLSHQRIAFGQAFLRQAAGLFSVIVLGSVLLLGYGICILANPGSVALVMCQLSGIAGGIVWWAGTYYLRFFSSRTQSFIDYASSTLMVVPAAVSVCDAGQLDEEHT